MKLEDGRKSFICSGCGKEHQFSLYVFSHWNTELQHTCDCGVKHSIFRGIADPIESDKGKK